MRINVDLLPGERLSLLLEAPTNLIGVGTLEAGKEDPLHLLLLGQGGYIFRIAEDLPVADLQSRTE
jgi:hypothetical protein